MTVVETTDVARELDDCRLHAEADAEERKSGLARLANRFDHAFDPTHPEAAGDEESVHRAKNLRGTIGPREVLTRHPLNVDANVVGDTAMNERLLHALVAVRVI